MYKQTFFAAVSILLSLPMQNGYAAPSIDVPDLRSRVSAAVAQMKVNEPEWLRALRQAENEVTRGTSVFAQHSVTAHKDLYNMRKGMLQDAQKGALAGYGFEVPVPEMLTDLSVSNFGYLFGFVQDMAAGKELDPAFTPEISKPERAVVQVTSTVEGDINLILRIDTTKKKVYFFKDAVTK